MPKSAMATLEKGRSKVRPITIQAFKLERLNDFYCRQLSREVAILESPYGYDRNGFLMKISPTDEAVQ